MRLNQHFIMNNNITTGKLIRVCKENNLYIVFRGSTQTSYTEIEINPQERTISLDKKAGLIYDGITTTQWIIDAFRNQGFSFYAIVGLDKDKLTEQDNILVITFDASDLRYISSYGDTKNIISHFKENDLIRNI